MTTSKTPATITSTFDEEFNSFTSSANGNSGWMTELPFWGSEHTLSSNNESQYYSNSATGVNPFSVSNGVLSITATAASGSTANALGLPYNSGIATTYKSFSQLYGYFEIRAQLPNGQGLWPAFWLLPGNFQPKTELDVFEVLGNQPSTLYATTHSAIPGSGVSQTLSVANTSAGFHTYGVDWEPDKITFYMDSAVIGSTQTPADMNVPMYMLLNLAVGGPGSWPGATNATTPIPATMQIDYVHAYSTAQTLGATDPTPQVAAAPVLPQITATSVGRSWVAALALHYGNQDGGSVLSGIGVALLNSNGQVVATGITDARGHYIFTGLAAGTYKVQYLSSSAYGLRAGGPADVQTGLSNSFTVGDGQGVSLLDQKFVSRAELTGSVQLNGTAIGNVTVKLLDSNKNLVGTSSTDASGRFTFWVPAGTFYVEYASAADLELQPGSHADPATHLSPAIALAEGQAFLLTPEMLVSQSSVTMPMIVTTAVGTSNVVALQANQIVDSWGSDRLTGGAGNTITIHGAATIAGGTGAQTINLTGAAASVTVDDLGTDIVAIGAGATGIVHVIQSASITEVAGVAKVFLSGSKMGAAWLTGGSGRIQADKSTGLIITTDHNASTIVTLGVGTSTITTGGADSIRGGPGSYMINVASANVMISGIAGSATINQSSIASTGLQFIGGAGAATLNLQSGGADVKFGAGTVTASSGGLANVFEVVGGHQAGQAVVNGFRVGIDHLVTHGLSLVSQAVNNGAAQLLFTDGSKLQLIGVTDLSKSLA